MNSLSKAYARVSSCDLKVLDLVAMMKGFVVLAGTGRNVGYLPKGWHARGPRDQGVTLFMEWTERGNCSGGIEDKYVVHVYSTGLWDDETIDWQDLSVPGQRRNERGAGRERLL